MMHKRPIIHVVAVDNQAGFGKDGKIPWHIPEDFKRFKELTSNHICVMGRHTYNDINNTIGEKGAQSVLPNRKCFVISNTLTELPNATVIKEFNEIESYLKEEHEKSPIFVIGGQKIYEQYIPRADFVEMTIINHDYQCDRFYPVDYLAKYFHVTNVQDCPNNKEVKFITYTHNKYRNSQV